jgi:hypothetical protein
MNAADARPASSVTFDWTMGLLSALVMCGILVDAWAHSHGLVDQTFLTPWHALLYGSMALNGLVLLAAGLIGLRAGYPLRRALPEGYWTAALGVVVFLVAGGLDLVWHTIFGIETNITGFLSPTHLLLALGGAMVMTGPVRSIAAQYGLGAGGWRLIGPAVLGTWALLSLFGFFLNYAQPIGDGSTAESIKPKKTAAHDTLYAIDSKGRLQRLPTANADLWGVQASPKDGRIVYRVNTGTGDVPPSDIVVAAAGGTHAVQITHSGRHDTQPSWSPDGTRIAYVSMPANTSGNFQIHIVRSDGSGDRTLVDGVTTVQFPTWSPDGRTIAYASRNGLTEMLAKVDLATGKTGWLTYTPGALSPTWGQAGIAYVTGDGTLELASPGTGTVKKIVSNNATEPSWSPDGKTIVYVGSDGANAQIFTVDPHGGTPLNLSQLPGLAVNRPGWSPNGSIYFTAGAASQGEQGLDLAEAAFLLQGVTLAGAVLLLVRRWRLPVGALTLLLTAFAAASAVTSDLYVAVIPAAITGVVADVLILAMRDRARAGRGLAFVGFVVPALFSALLIATLARLDGGSAWAPNMLLGTPLLAGIAGMFVAFCFDLPIARGTSAR